MAELRVIESEAEPVVDDLRVVDVVAAAQHGRAGDVVGLEKLEPVVAGALGDDGGDYLGKLAHVAGVDEAPGGRREAFVGGEFRPAEGDAELVEEDVVAAGMKNHSSEAL